MGRASCYVLADSANLGDDHIRRFESRKELHVSPFMDMDIDYSWLLTPPANNLVVRISNYANRERIFAATLILRRQEISGRSLAVTLLSYPFMTLKVITAIHWQALRLWRRAARSGRIPKTVTGTGKSMSEFELAVSRTDEVDGAVTPRLLERVARKVVLRRLANLQEGQLTLYDGQGQYVLGNAQANSDLRV